LRSLALLGGVEHYHRLPASL